MACVVTCGVTVCIGLIWSPHSHQGKVRDCDDMTWDMRQGEDGELCVVKLVWSSLLNQAPLQAFFWSFQLECVPIPK